MTKPLPVVGAERDTWGEKLNDYLAEQEALKASLASPAFTGNPTGITKAHVGLGSVDNTADTAKPVSTAQGVALAAKLDATVASVTYDRVFKPEAYGADPTGAADSTAAVRAAFDAANATRVVSIGENAWHPGATVALCGTYNLATLAAPLVASCNVRAAGATLVVPASYAGVALLVGHETSGNVLHNADLALPNIVKAIVDDFTVGSIGARVQNLTHSTLRFGRIQGFETAQHYTGLGIGTAYNQIFIGWTDLCKIGLNFSPLTGGWANQNSFIGGGISQSLSGIPGAVTRRSGYRHLVMDGGAGWSIHANIFVGTSFEGDLSEFCFDFHNAVDNTFIGTRFEQGTAGIAVSTGANLLHTDDSGLYATAHGLAVGMGVAFICTTDPGGMVSGSLYYVVSVAGEAFTVSATAGGTAIAFTADTGSGVLVFRPPTLHFDNTDGNCRGNIIRDYNSYPGPLDVVRIGAAAPAAKAPIVG